MAFTFSGWVVRYRNHRRYKGTDRYLVMGADGTAGNTFTLEKATLIHGEDKAMALAEQYPMLDDAHERADVVPVRDYDGGGRSIARDRVTL